jgi:Flp pilus assembly protein TadD
LQERYQEAIQDYSRALQLNPQHVKAYYNRAVALERHGRLDEALSDYSRAAQLDGSNSSAHLNAGLLLCKLGRWVGGELATGLP